MFRYSQQNGFTLIEMAFLIVIIGVLTVALLRPLEAVMQKRIHDTTETTVKEAIIASVGFALLNKRLPCPDTDDDGIENCGGTGTITGTCPYVTLGIECRDGWENVLTYEVSGSFEVEKVTGADSSSKCIPATTTTGEYRDFTTANNIQMDCSGSIEVVADSDAADSINDAVYSPLRVSGQGQKDSDGNAMTVEHWLPMKVLVQRFVKAGIWEP
jgi:type II secretory pathway pseudopilin PulG